MNIKFPLTVIAVVLFFSLAIFLPDAADARGRGGGGRGRGGGRYSRGGPAASGGFSSRSSARRAPTRRPTTRKPATREAPARQDARSQRPEKRRDVRDERTDRRRDVAEERQDFVEDRWDDHRHHHRRRAAFATGVAVGAVASSNYVTTLSCSPTIVIANGGVTYYNCGSIWYTRGNVSGEIVYVVATTPAGY